MDYGLPAVYPVYQRTLKGLDILHEEQHTVREPRYPRMCFCMLKMIRPKRIIEVGSGYLTLLMMDVNERFLDNATSITSIEPYPRPFLSTAHTQGRITLVQKARAGCGHIRPT